MHPLPPEPELDFAAARRADDIELQLQILREVFHFGADVTRILQMQAANFARDVARPNAPATVPPMDVGFEFDRHARALRRTMMLFQKLGEPVKPPAAEPATRAAPAARPAADQGPNQGDDTPPPLRLDRPDRPDKLESAGEFSGLAETLRPTDGGECLDGPDRIDQRPTADLIAELGHTFSQAKAQAHAAAPWIPMQPSAFEARVAGLMHPIPSQPGTDPP